MKNFLRKIILFSFIILLSSCNKRRVTSHSTIAENSSIMSETNSVKTLMSYAEKKEIWLNEKMSKFNLLNPCQHYQFLKELKWLIGEWEADTHYGKIYSKYYWGKYKNYIVFDVTIIASDGIKTEGVELISYDEHKKIIRSWFLSSLDILSPEEYWIHKENNWIVETPSPMPGSLRSIYSDIHHDTFVWEQKIYTEDGTFLQKIDPIMNVRKK